MSKSKFPNKLDSSIEIPAVRDNIIEVGSDVINSLRSAIFQIEKTLGINPQGAAGNTVAKRLNRALDGNGNILKDALDQSNLLSGPIANNNVSNTAAISESKLKLNFPTSLLQDEISILDKQLESIISQVEELSLKLSSHIHPDAINRHKAKAITVDEIAKAEGELGIDSTQGGTAQEVFQEIFSSHINYDGKNTGPENKSHSASQIYFDNTNVIDKVRSLNTQDAIEEILNIDGSDITNHQNLFHSNGLLRSVDSIGWTTTGEQLPLVGPVKISFSGTVASNSARLVTVYFDEPIDISSMEVLKSDIFEIIDDDLSVKFQIYETILDNGLLSGLTLFGNLNSDSTLATKGSIYKNRNQPAQLSSLLIGVRPDINHTSAETIQIADPRSTAIFTYGLRPFEISVDNRYIGLEIDGGGAITIDLYDDTLDSQSVDSIVNKVNIQLLSGGHPALAYRAEMPYGGVEIAIVHNIPSGPSKDYSLKIVKSNDEGITSAGLSYMDGLEVYSRAGNYFYINGLTKVGLALSMSRSDLFATDGTTFIESSEVSLLNDNVLKNNLINVFKDSSVETYKISSLSDLKITVDIEQLPNGFSDASSVSKFEVYENTISFESHTFDEINNNSASGIFDIFIGSDGHLLSNKCLSYESNYSFGANSAISIVDFYGVANNNKIINAEIVDAETIEISLGSGAPFKFKKFLGSGFYRELHDGLFSVKVHIDKFSTLYSYINSSSNVPDSGSISIPLNLFSDVNREENLYIGRIHYESAIGRVSGAGSNMPRVISATDRGTTGFKDISSDAIYKLVHEPISDLRSNGVISELNVSQASDGQDLSDGLFKLSISEGVCYVSGERFEISGGIDIVTNIDSVIVDKFYVAINSLGEFVFSPADAVTCGCLLNTSNHCILAAVEWDNISSSFIDLRLFIDNLDLKLLNAITVSPEPGMGHFANLPDALQYAKRFSEIFTKAGTPSIHMKSGTHVVEVDMKSPLFDGNGQLISIGQDNLILSSFDAGLVINFPVKIIGEGESTIIDIRRVWEDDTGDLRGSPPSAGVRGLRQEGVIYILGDGISDAVRSRVVSALDDGFAEISNLKLRQCKIAAFGMNTSKTIDNVDYELNCGAKLHDLLFDYSENKGNDPNGPNPNQSSVGQPVFILGGLGNNAVSQGNVFIKNCNFIFSKIMFANINASALKNISIIDNKFLGTGLKSSITHSGGAFDMVGNADDGTIFDPLVGDYGKNNVNIYGNINRSNPNDGIDGEQNRQWGDRVNKNLIIGNNIGIKYGFPQHELVIKGGENDTPPVIEMKNSNIAGEESRIVFTTVQNGADVVVGKMGYETDGGGMFMRSGDGNTGLTVNSLGVQATQRFYATSGFTVFDGAAKNWIQNETGFGGLTTFSNVTTFLDNIEIKDKFFGDGIRFSSEAEPAYEAKITPNSATGNLTISSVGAPDLIAGPQSSITLDAQDVFIEKDIRIGTAGSSSALEFFGEPTTVRFQRDNARIEFDEPTSRIVFKEDNSFIEFDGDNSSLEFDGDGSKINFAALNQELNFTGIASELNLTGERAELNFNSSGGHLMMNLVGAAARTSSFIFNETPLDANGHVGQMKLLVFVDAAPAFEIGTDAAGKVTKKASMRKLKDDIKDLEFGLKEVGKMRPVSFSPKSNRGKVCIGFIAEELHDVSSLLTINGPDYPVDGETGFEDMSKLLSNNIVPRDVDNIALIAVLISAVQELSQKVKDLEEKANA